MHTIPGQSWLSPHHLPLLSGLCLCKAWLYPGPCNGGSLCIAVLCFKPSRSFQLIEWTPASPVQSPCPRPQSGARPHLLLPWPLRLFFLLPAVEFSQKCICLTPLPLTSIQSHLKEAFLRDSSSVPKFPETLPWPSDVTFGFSISYSCIMYVFFCCFPPCSSHQNSIKSGFLSGKSCKSGKKMWIISHFVDKKTKAFEG